MHDLDLKTLRLFAAVCDHRNIKLAADEAHIEPSAISKRLAQLERTVGTALLDRGRRGVTPTPAGLALLDHARTMLFTAQRIESDIASFRGGIRGHVRLVASVSAVAGSLLEDVAVFMADPANRAIKVDIEERVSRDVVRLVREGRASLGVCWDSVDFMGLQTRLYRSDHLALAVYGGHPLAGRKAIGFAETLDFQHVGMQPSSAVHGALQRAAARAGRTIDYRVIVSSFDAAFRVVAAGLGISVLPLHLSKLYAWAGQVEMIPISDRWAERQFALCSLAPNLLPSAATRMVDYLEERAANG
jgi:DNA-binding transcriptional LysR family regulator